MAAAVALLALTEAPWASVQVTVLGVESPMVQVSARELGSDLGMSVAVAVGLVAVACAVVSVVGSVRAMRIAALVAVVVVGYFALTAASNSIHAMAAGRPVDDLVGARVSSEWGAWASLAAAVCLLLLARRERVEEELEDEERELDQVEHA